MESRAASKPVFVAEGVIVRDLVGVWAFLFPLVAACESILSLYFLRAVKSITSESASPGTNSRGKVFEELELDDDAEGC